MGTMDRADALRVLEQVTDPEIPVLTIADLGILRAVEVDEAGTVHVDITPTYSGCPAMDEIRTDVRTALEGAGATAVDVRLVHPPAWTTDWMTEAGRRKLAAYGIAPPGARPAGGPVAARARLPAGPGRRRHRRPRLPPLRLGRHRGARPVRLDRLQVAVALHRRAASPSTTSRSSEP